MKRHISEFFDNLSPEASKIFGQYTIKENLDDVSCRRIYDNVMSGINAENSADASKENKAKVRSGGRKFSKIAIVAAACVAAMAISGVGVGATQLYKSYTDYKPNYTEKQKAVIDEARFTIDKQNTANDAFNGITFTATEGMRDDRMVYVLLNVKCDPSITGDTKDRGISIYSDLWRKDVEIGGTAVYSETLAHEGDTYTVLLGYDMGNYAVDNGQEVELSIGSVSLDTLVYDSKAEKNRLDNHWYVSSENAPTSISFTISGKKANFGRQLYTDEKILFMDQETDIDLGYISPWCGQFSLYSKGDDYDSFQIRSGTPDVKITMNDGTVYTTDKGIKIRNGFTGQASANKHKNAYVCRWDLKMKFDNYINTLDIKSIEINGVEVNIEDIDMSKHFAGLDYYWSTEY